LDRWIVTRLSELVKSVTNGLENYQIDIATRPISIFIDDLSTWYLQCSRERFKAEGEEQKMALGTLRYILYTLACIMAPSMPFYSEYLFQIVKEKDDLESVHLASWPIQKTIDEDLLFSMEYVRNITSQALERRENKKIKVKQPLLLLKVQTHLPGSFPDADLLEEIVKERVNVKEIQWSADVPFLVELDTTITPELKREGEIRELVRAVQDERKKSGLTPGQQVMLAAAGDEEFMALIHDATVQLQKVANITSITEQSNSGTQLSIVGTGTISIVI
jgi:isoleucyl-tRNA synthetase